MEYFTNMIQENNSIEDVKKFLDKAPKAQDTFRYFKKRPVDVIKQHVVTLLGYDDGEVVSYGHLDQEDDVVWLGICVADSAPRKGFGKNMMDALMAKAIERGIPRIRLSVDSSNIPAVRLYEKFGFVLIEVRNNTSFYEKEMPMHTIGALVDKLTTVNLKMWNNQELLYEIRRMTFDEFKSKYFATEDGSEKLWACLKKCCDLNVQRNQVMDEIDERLVELVKRAVKGEDLDDGTFIQRSHKTY